jgi:mono/diheme cytochrome c family protein
MNAKKYSPSLHTWGLLSLALIFAGLALMAWPNMSQAAPPAQTPDTTPAISAGRTLWQENCLPCHGPGGQGDGPTAQSIDNPLPNFADPETARQLTPVNSFDVIKNGRMENMMPPWSDRLSDAQIWDAVAYVWSLGTTPQELAAGETLYLEQCAACHGENGTGDGPEAPAEMIDFTDLKMMVQQSQADLQANFKAGDQHAQLSNFSQEELWQSLDYIRTFSFALPQRNGVLTGQVINATTNEPLGDIEVTLHVFEGNTEIETLTTQTDSTGNYTFEKLLTDHSILYMIESDYQDIVYLSDEPGLFTPNSNETTLNLKVYETTTSDEEINITQFHYLVSFSPGMVNVVHVFIVGNSSNQTYIGQNGETFSFSLPDKATGVTFQNDPVGTRFVQTANGYADTEPVVPGREGLSIVATYDIPYDDDSLTIELPFSTDVAALNVLLNDQGADLSSDQVQFVETRQVQGSSFSIFNGTNLSQEDRLTLKLTNLDDLAFAAGSNNIPSGAVAAHAGVIDQDLLRWLVIGLGGMMLIVAGVIYPYYRPRLTSQGEASDQDPETYRQRLLLTLARLDDLFEAGELDEQVYRQTRARYKAELAEMMEQ